MSIRNCRDDLEKALKDNEKLRADLKESRRIAGLHRSKLSTRDIKIQKQAEDIDRLKAELKAKMIDGRQAVVVKPNILNEAWVKS